MTGILAFILYIAGFCLLARWAMVKAAVPSNRIMILVVLFFVYSCFAGGFAMLAYVWGDPGLVLFMLCLFFALTAVGNVILTISRSHREIKAQCAALFLLYVFAILMVTLITRRPRAEAVLMTELFAGIKSVLREGSVEELNHMILNIVMFMPLGYLFVQMHPRKLGSPVQVLGVGVMLSTFIEGCQLVFRLGNCDVDDILANTIGAFLGWALFKAIHRNDG